MKKLKNFLLLPIIALGSLVSCYSKTEECPEQKDCDNAKAEDTSSKSLDINIPELKMINGTTRKLVPTATPSNTTFKFSSTNESVATVTSDGTVTAISDSRSCNIVVTGSNGVTKYVPCLTYTANNYFTYSGAKVTGCVDKYAETLDIVRASSSINQIDAGAFIGMEYLKEVIVPEGIVSIFGHAFGGTKLDKLSLPSTLIYFEYQFGALGDCKEIVFPNGSAHLQVYENLLIRTGSNSSHGSSAYQNSIVAYLYGFNGIVPENIRAEKGIRNIAHGAFANFKGESLVLPEGINEMGNYIFNKVKVNTLHMPSTITKNGNNLFDGASINHFDEMTFSSINSTFTNDSWYATNVSGGNKYFYYGTNQGTIPDDRTYITSNAFLGREFVNKKLKIPSSVNTIAEFAFSFVSGLKALFIPSSVTSFGPTNLTSESRYFNGTLGSIVYNYALPVGILTHANDDLIVYVDSEERKAQFEDGGAFAHAFRKGVLNERYEIRVCTEEEFDALVV